MNWIQAIILGLVQGLTEFLPVSSSAHLRLTKRFLGIADGEHLLYFDLFCHAGTLLALVIFLRKDIWEVLKSIRKIAIYSLAIAPLVPAYFLMKPVRIAASDPAYLGYFLIVTGVLLFAASRRKVAVEVISGSGSHTGSGSFIEQPKWRDVVCIGVMQALALIPGISRSGSTIAAARFCGWDWMDAARFSFLLAVPTILGGELLETAKLLGGHSDGGVSIGCYAAGFGASFGLGLFAVRWIFRIYKKGNVRPFAWYCIGIGLLAMMIFNG